MTQPIAIKQCLLNASHQDLQIAAEILMRTLVGRNAVSRTLGHLKDAYDEWNLFPYHSEGRVRTPPRTPRPPQPPVLLPDMSALASGPDLAVYAHNSCLWVRIPDFRDLQPEARVAPLHVGVAAAIAGCLGAKMAQEFGCYQHVADLRKQKKWVVKDPVSGERQTFLKAEHAHKRVAALVAELKVSVPYAEITIPVEEVLE